ncbi:MFS transporter [Amphritea japonica]|uniref:MFS transporter n=1 Tax=Amphritea japonica ATCC BAA-1530 TaxID=1278309 RepID=A0A7R6SUE0_9GAMM|nr:MFS transporter [Amphritea japonica]BBB27615.1 MFS transporter [Amphritea japonica ATCC BAA-1530]
MIGRSAIMLFFSGCLQLIFITSLAAFLIFAAYERAATNISLIDIIYWGGYAITLPALLLAIIQFNQRRIASLSGISVSHLMMALCGVSMSLLCLQHFLQGPETLPLFDLGTALLITFLFSLELAVYQQSGSLQPTQKTVHFKQMRPAIFLFLFGIDLSMAFIPLHMEALPQSLRSISPDLLIGLPISVEFFCVGVAILCCGVWLDKSGWKPPFYTGLVITGLGCLYSWLAPDAVQFILSRGVLGFGYGLTLLASQGYVIKHTDSSNKARGLAHLFAGLYSGSICGAATGAVLAEQFGYGSVFLLGALIVFCVIFYGLMTLSRSAGGGVKKVEQAKTAGSVKGSNPDNAAHYSPSFISFLSDRQVLAATLFSSMPASIAVVGFLNYFSPVYLNRAGLNDASIGQVLMLFGVVLALLGPAIGRFADQSETKRGPIVLGCVLGGGAFLVFGIFEGVVAVTLSVLLLGLSNCLVLSAQSAFVLKQEITGRYGEGKSMGIFRSSSRIGQMLGPVIFAAIIATTNIENSVMMFGVIYLVTAILFALLTWAPRVSPVVKTVGITHE